MLPPDLRYLWPAPAYSYNFIIIKGVAVDDRLSRADGAVKEGYRAVDLLSFGARLS
jgi:hypothetical protein